jgi:hypothetical protein
MINGIDRTNNVGPKESATLGSNAENSSTACAVNPPWNAQPGGRFMISLFEALGKYLSGKSREVNSILDVTE